MAPQSQPIVLLIDPYPDDRQMYAEYLSTVGLRPIECDNTEEALAAAPGADVIVTGLRLAGPFDGLELIRRLRLSEQTRSKPILVLTACVWQTDRDQAQLAGCDAFLPKPCLPQALATEIKLVWQQSRALRAAGHRQRTRAAKARLRSEALLHKSREVSERLRRRK